MTMAAILTACENQANNSNSSSESDEESLDIVTEKKEKNCNEVFYEYLHKYILLQQ